MRVAIDLQGALTHGSRTRGIGRYTLQLASSLAQLSASHDLRLMINDNHGAAATILTEPSIAALPAGAVSRYRVPRSSIFAAAKKDPQRRAADAIVRRHVAALHADALLLTSCFEMETADFSPLDLQLYPVKLKAAILYDLIPMLFSEDYLRDGRIKQCYFEITETLQTADLLLAISESSRHDAITNLGISPDKIVNISSGADRRFRRLAMSEEERHGVAARVGVSRPFVLYAAGADARKNLKGAIAAFAALPETLRRRHQLLLVTNLDAGGRADHIRYAARLGLRPDELVVCDPISDEDLVAVLNTCSVLLFASLYEGFGLPVLEAMRCGTVVVAGNNSSLPEIVDRQDILFDAANAASMAATLARALTDDNLRSDVSRWGPRRAEAFTWERCARAALAAMQERLEAPTAPRYAILPSELLDLDGARLELADALRGSPRATAQVEECVDSLLFSVPRFQQGAPRLLIDVTDARKSGAWTGIQRVVRKLTAALYEQPVDDDGLVPVAVDLDGPAPQTVPDFLAVTLSRAGMPRQHSIEIRAGDDLLMLDSNWIAYPSLTPLFDTIQGRGGRVITAVYDLIPELNPEFCGEGMPQAHARWLHAAVLSSDALLCISRAVADQVVAYVRGNAIPYRKGLKIGWFHLGSDVVRAGEDRVAQPRIAAAFAGPRPVLLSVGTLEPRKGHALALDGFERLWAQGVDVGLCFMGVLGWKCDDLRARIEGHPEQGKRLFWFADAKDADIVHGYAHAAAVLCMSYAEGFGLPIAEAARMNRPTLCSDIAVFKEVGGDGVAYFRSGQPESLADAVAAWLGGRSIVDPSRVSRCTWDEAATRVRDILRRDDWYDVLH